MGLKNTMHSIILKNLQTLLKFIITNNKVIMTSQQHSYRNLSRSLLLVLFALRITVGIVHTVSDGHSVAFAAHEHHHGHHTCHDTSTHETATLALSYSPEDSVAGHCVICQELIKVFSPTGDQPAAFTPETVEAEPPASGRITPFPAIWWQFKPGRSPPRIS